MDDKHELIRKYVPGNIMPIGGFAASLLLTARIHNKKNIALLSNTMLSLDYEYRRYVRRLMPNNRLKMKGIPMRRRSKKFGIH